MLRRLRPLFTLICCAVVSLSPPDAFPRPGPALSAEELFRPMTIGRVQLSPDGRHLGAIVNDDSDLRGLLFIDLATFKHTGLRGRDAFDIHSFRWLGNDRILFTVTKDKLYSWGLFTAPIDNLGDHFAINNFDLTEIVGVPRSRPARVLVWILNSAADAFHRSRGLVELDTTRPHPPFGPQFADDEIARVYTSPPGETVMDWEANDDGELSLGWTWSAGRVQLYRYLRAQDAWRHVSLPQDASMMALDPDDRFLWVVTHGPENGYELRRFDMDTGGLGPPVHTDPTYDFATGRLHFSRRTGALAGLTYVRREPSSVWLSKNYATIQAAVDHAHPDTNNQLLQSDDRGRKFLFRLTGPRQPGAYVVLDLDTKALHLLAETAPWLKDRPLLPTKIVDYVTRDGIRLEACLTVPPGATPEHPAPLVVLPHGGPWTRDTLAFDPEVQFLASRGYIVLQPNYRGSTGYAPEISDKYRYDFRRMHDDVTDATKSVLRDGIADPGRVAIMGSSFGGYLALTGVAFEDGLYRCAVTACGVFDWEQHIRAKKDEDRPGEYEMLRDRIGQPGRDQASLAAFSPLAQADRIRVPVFIAHGKDDFVVDAAQSRKLAAALKKRGVPHETFFRKLEGHGFYNYKNRVEYYRRVEAFLAANLSPAAPSAAK